MIAQWTPQPGPQTRAASCPCDITLFGGSRGGGKTDCLLGRQLIGAWNYGRHWNGLVVRRKYKDFAELRRRVDDLIAQGLPAERIGGDRSKHGLNLAGGCLVWVN